MGILDQLVARSDHLNRLEHFLDTRKPKEKEEWLEALRRGDLYTCPAIVKLMKEHGFETNENAVYRFRNKLEDYVPSR